MSKFVRAQPYHLEFEGDKVSCLITPIGLADAIEVSDVVRKRDARLLLEIYQRLLPNYVSKFDGLRDAAGSAIELVEVVQTSYFTSIVKELGAALIGTASPSDPPEPVELSAARLADVVPLTATPNGSAG